MTITIATVKARAKLYGITVEEDYGYEIELFSPAGFRIEDQPLHSLLSVYEGRDDRNEALKDALGDMPEKFDPNFITPCPAGCPCGLGPGGFTVPTESL